MPLQALNRAMPHSCNQLEENVSRKEIFYLVVVYIEVVENGNEAANLRPHCSLVPVTINVSLDLG